MRVSAIVRVQHSIAMTLSIASDASSRNLLYCYHGPMIASRHKYLSLIRKLRKFEVTICREDGVERRLRIGKPDCAVVYGDRRTMYRHAMRKGVPYILCQHDVSSLRGQDSLSEPEMITNARRIIFTSEEHQEYIVNRYDYRIEDTCVIHLRPAVQDIEFTPMPKRAALSLAYAGGLERRQMSSDYGYRMLQDVFSSFMISGWEVHVYPARPSRRTLREYRSIGCQVHEHVPQDRLYRELSQYHAGFLGYNNIDVSDAAWQYTQTCRPNKLWEYLAAGIPTVAFNISDAQYDIIRRWAFRMMDLADIPKIQLPEIESLFRQSEVIENDADKMNEVLSL